MRSAAPEMEQNNLHLNNRMKCMKHDQRIHGASKQRAIEKREKLERFCKHPNEATENGQRLRSRMSASRAVLVLRVSRTLFFKMLRDCIGRIRNRYHRKRAKPKSHSMQDLVSSVTTQRTGAIWDHLVQKRALAGNNLVWGKLLTLLQNTFMSSAGKVVISKYALLVEW